MTSGFQHAPTPLGVFWTTRDDANVIRAIVPVLFSARFRTPMPVSEAYVDPHDSLSSDGHAPQTGGRRRWSSRCHLSTLF